jgi:hypothetical protein
MSEIIYLILALSVLIGIAYILLKYPNIAEHYDNPSPEIHTPNLASLGLSNSMPRVTTGDKTAPEPNNFMEAMNQMMLTGQTDASKNDPKAALESITKMFENASSMKFGDYSTPQNIPPNSKMGTMSPLNALQTALATQKDTKSKSTKDDSQCLMKCTREFQKCSSSC